MDTIAISRFKARCLAILERVRTTREPVLVTRFGKPVAEIVPPSSRQAGRSWLGAFRDEIEIVDDIVSPAVDAREWEALRE